MERSDIATETVVVHQMTYGGEKLSRLREFLIDQDSKFHPPLAARFSIDEYVEKVFREGIVLAATCSGKDEVEGVAIFYCTPSKYDYAFMSYIASRQRVRGVGTKLLQEVISRSRRAGMKGVEMQTWESNQASQSLFRKFNFENVGLADNRGIAEKSVLFRLNF